jgi:hypothetical protein
MEKSQHEVQTSACRWILVNTSRNYCALSSDGTSEKIEFPSRFSPPLTIDLGAAGHHRLMVGRLPQVSGEISRRADAGMPFAGALASANAWWLTQERLAPAG